MSKYTEDFRRSAIELMKRVGITKACKELRIAHCTLYRWCREMEGEIDMETEEPTDLDIDAVLAERTDESPQETEQTSSAALEDESFSGGDSIATAMAMLVIENTHLREIIKHLRDTISGLTDHSLL